MKTRSVHLKGWQSVRDSEADTGASDTSTDRSVTPEAKWVKREGKRCKKREGSKVQECSGSGAGACQRRRMTREV